VKIDKFYPFLLKTKNATVLGYADVTVEGLLRLKNLKLVKKKNGGTFVSYPSLQDREGNFVQMVEILDRNLREEIRRVLSDYYKKHFEE